jgi:hypothetical protein
MEADPKNRERRGEREPLLKKSVIKTASPPQPIFPSIE